MDATKLKYFVSAAYNLNFSEVARFNFISQPTISHQIDLLEQELEVKLFHRNGKKLTLTTEGEYFLPLAVQLLEDMQSAAINVKQYSAGAKGKLDIMLSETCLDSYRECLGVFSRRYPEIAIETHSVGTPDQLEAIIKGCYDIYFSFEKIIKMNAEFEYIKTVRDCLCLALPADFPPPRDMNDFSTLSDMPFIGLSATVSTFLQEDIRQIMERRGFAPKLAHKYNKLRDMLIPIELGLGFSIFPYSIALDTRRNICCIPLDDDCGKVDRVLAWKRNSHNRAVDLFVGVAKEIYAG